MRFVRSSTVLAASEAVNNAVLYGCSPVTVRVRTGPASD
jgi:hypothetical protein